MTATVYEHSLAIKLKQHKVTAGPQLLTCVSTAPKLALAASSVAVPT